jgi:hypothetical protein
MRQKIKPRLWWWLHTMEFFWGETLNSRLHFKITTSLFQTKLWCLCTRARRGFRLHRPFRAATGALFSPKPPTPPHRPPPFHSIVPIFYQNSIARSPSPRFTPEPFPVPACLTWPCAVCRLFSINPTFTAVPNTRPPAPHRLHLLASRPRAYLSCNPRLSCRVYTKTCQLLLSITVRLISSQSLFLFRFVCSQIGYKITKSVYMFIIYLPNYI